MHDNHVMSFDAAVRSVSQESGPMKVIPVEDHSHSDMKNVIPVSEIEEDQDGKGNKRFVKFSCANGPAEGSSASVFGSYTTRENGSTSEICSESQAGNKESAIRRENEGDFRLLGRRMYTMADSTVEGSLEWRNQNECQVWAERYLSLWMIASFAVIQMLGKHLGMQWLMTMMMNTVIMMRLQMVDESLK